MKTAAILPSLLLGLLLSACGDPPVPVDPQVQPAADPHAGMEMPSGVQPQPGEVLFAGQAVLSGELDVRPNSCFYVTVRSSRGAWLVRRYGLGDAEVEAEGDRRVLDFELNVTHSMMPQAPPASEELAIKVSYVPSGFVEDTQGGAEAIQPVTRGDLSIRLELVAGP